MPAVTSASELAPLRVCFLIPDHPSNGNNGPTREGLQTAQALAARGEEAHVIGYAAEPSAPRLIDGVWRRWVSPAEAGIPELAGVPFARELCTAVAKYREVIRLHRQAPVDLVIATPWPGESLVCLLDRRLAVLTRLVTSVKFMTDTGLLPDEPWSMMVRLEQAVIARSSYFSAASDAIVADTASTFGVRLPPIEPIPLCTPDRAREITRAERLASPDQVLVLAVGRNEPRKGIDVLLAAARRLAHEHPEAVFAFAGDGDWEGVRLEVQGDARLRDRVVLLGTVDDARLWRLYAGADLVCVPSRYESFGQVLIEAMMFGKPVVASSVGGIPSVVEEGGNALLAPAGDPDRLALCLRQLIGSAELRGRFGRRSRDLYEQRYSVDVVAARKAEHLRSIRTAERQRRARRRLVPTEREWWRRLRRHSQQRLDADPGYLPRELSAALEEVTGLAPSDALRVAAELLGGVPAHHPPGEPRLAASGAP